MSTIDLINGRRTVRMYDPNFTIPKAHMEELIRVAKNSPTALNYQGLDLVIVTSRKKIDEITAIAYDSWAEEDRGYWDSRREKFGVTNVLTCDASALFFVVKNERAQGQFTGIDAGELIMSVIIAARSLGYETMNFGAITWGNKAGVEKAIGVEGDSMITAFVVGKARPDNHVEDKECNMNVRMIE